MDITWDMLIKESGGASVGGKLLALLPPEGNVILAERTGKTFALTDRGEAYVKEMEAREEAAKAEAAAQAAEAAKPAAVPEAVNPKPTVAAVAGKASSGAK